MRFNLFLVVLICCFSVAVHAQLTEAAPPSKSNFKAQFLKKKGRVNNKTTACGSDTLYYARYNATMDRYLNVSPGASSSPQTGIGTYFAIDDTVWIHGFNFYAYAASASTPVKCNVYYADKKTREPAGVPLATTTYSLTTGFTYLPWMLQRVTFSSPVRLVSDFVITIETTNNTQLVVALNDWETKDGKSKFYSSIKFPNGWTNTGITIGTDAFDADFYLEPAVSYNLTSNFKHGPKSCLGNGQAFEFVNTTTHVLNKQFSPEAIDTTLDDNFLWDYGDGSPIDTLVHGNNTYGTSNNFFVTLDATFNNWTGTCKDDTVILLEESDLKANFQSKANGLLVEFSDKSTDATEWQWDFGDNTNGSQSPNPTHLYQSYGVYQVNLIVKNKGCINSTTLALSLVNNSVGIEEIEQGSLDINIAPNPAIDFLNLEINAARSDELKWRIYSIQGKEILDGSMGVSQQKIDLNKIGPGVYFIQVNDGHAVQTKRFIVQ